MKQVFSLSGFLPAAAGWLLAALVAAISVAEAASVSAVVTPAEARAGESVVVSGLITLDQAVAGAHVILKVASGAGEVFAERHFDEQSFAAGVGRPYQFQYDVPASIADGPYYIQAGAWSSGWEETYAFTANAATFKKVPPPALNFVAATASPAVIARGESTALSAVLSSTGAVSGAHVLIKVLSPGSQVLAESAFLKNFGSGESATFTANFTAGASLSDGNYLIQVGAWSADWSKTYFWRSSVGSFRVSTPATGPSIPALPAPTPGSVTGSLRELGARRGKFVGAAAVTHMSGNGNYQKAWREEFSITTAEYEMKMDALQPREGVFDFIAADRFVEAAIANGQLVRGHALAWHNSIPAWVKSRARTPAERAQLLETHIRTVVAHFRDKYPGRVAVWDVVNEAIRDYWGDLRIPEAPNADPYHVSYWASIGSAPGDYIKLAFRVAHETDPAAQLYYNDYGTEEWNPAVTPDGRPSKASGVYNLVRSLVNEHVPIHGVGLQFHVWSGGNVNTAAVIENMRQLGALGLRVQITEMDAESPDTANFPWQATQYGGAMDACLASVNCDAFVSWGITDAVGWNPGAKMFMFDASYAKKPAYFRLVDSLSGVAAP